jgi:2-methylcitrate dehydratase PrpD
MDGQTTAVSFIRNARWDELPDPVQRKLKLCLVDMGAAIVSGALTPVSEITASYAAEAWKGEDATILLHGSRARPAGAAFANATTANGLDCDDQDDLTLGHPGVMVFPTALALCEKYELGGKEMLTAAAVGYEIALRAGRCWHWQHLPVYHADGSWGAVACAATAAHLMKLDENQTRHALGIAEYKAPQVPMEHDLVNPAMVKSGHGWAAMTGIVSAELAERGFTGTPGLMGLEKFEDWVSTIGTKFLIVDKIYFKRFCGCGWAHMAVSAAQKLQREHDWHVDDIKTITVEGHRWTSLLSTAHPVTTEEAQFSVQWTLAAFLIDGALGPDQLLGPRLGDPKINELVDKIELIESKELTEFLKAR